MAKSLSLSDYEARLSKVKFDICLTIHQLLHTPIPVVHREGIKLHKIDVPIFDGRWRTARQLFKDGRAQDIIERLSGSGSEYEEAMKCL